MGKNFHFLFRPQYNINSQLRSQINTNSPILGQYNINDQSEASKSLTNQSQDWLARIKEVSSTAAIRDTESKRRERSLRIATELSNLVIYCKSVMFNSEKMLSGHFTEMSSFPETKAEKLMSGPGGDAVCIILYSHELRFRS